MPPSIPALVKPDLLVWARQSSGLSLQDTATKLGQPIERVGLWEQGEDHPTIPQLRRLAEIYQRPLSVFYLPYPPQETESIKDFRQLDAEVSRSYSSSLRALIRNVQYRRETAMELAGQLNEPTPEFPVIASMRDDPEHLAERLRTVIGTSYLEQVRWREPYIALKSWIQALEKLGLLVFQSSDVLLKEMRGFSIGEEPFPIILINSKDYPNGRIFTLMHELTHIALRRGGVCNLEIDESHNATTEEQATEVFCNHVAGAILVPRASLLAESLIRLKTPEIEFTNDDLEHLAKRYQVSKEVITRRLLILNQVSQRFYQRKRQEFFEDYRRHAENGERSGGAPPVFRRALAKNGHAFSRLVVESYNSDRITASDVSDYLGIRLKHLPKLEAALFSRGNE